MKIKVTFKCPDALYYALEEIEDDAKREEAREKLKKWISGGEYCSIEVDTETGEAKVLPAK